ncbi:MAG: hypothetical protein U0572_14160 [Phycisphaerales bacterium]
MRRDGTDPDNVQMSDVLCDFCLREWTEDVPFIEGHHGSCVCGDCLAAAYRAVVVAGRDDRVADCQCTMCLERRDEAVYRSPTRDVAFICRRCIKLAAGTLERDKDHAWRRPES